MDPSCSASSKLFYNRQTSLMVLKRKMEPADQKKSLRKRAIRAPERSAVPTREKTSQVPNSQRGPPRSPRRYPSSEPVPKNAISLSARDILQQLKTKITLCHPVHGDPEKIVRFPDALFDLYEETHVFFAVGASTCLVMNATDIAFLPLHHGEIARKLDEWFVEDVSLYDEKSVQKWKDIRTAYPEKFDRVREHVYQMQGSTCGTCRRVGCLKWTCVEIMHRHPEEFPLLSIPDVRLDVSECLHAASLLE